MSKGYKLNTSYQGNYNSTDLSSNPEMILYKAYKEGLLMHSTIDYTCSSTQISGMSKMRSNPTYLKMVSPWH